MEHSETLRGICHFFSETGTEGGYWAFQDAKHIHPADSYFPHGHWSYAGLHILMDGDQLTIMDKDDPAKIIWSGEIKLKTCPLFTESARGMWIHADQEGIDRATWSEWFHKEYPATLVLGPNHFKIKKPA